LIEIYNLQLYVQLMYLQLYLQLTYFFEKEKKYFNLSLNIGISRIEEAI